MKSFIISVLVLFTFLLAYPTSAYYLPNYNLDLDYYGSDAWRLQQNAQEMERNQQKMEREMEQNQWKLEQNQQEIKRKLDQMKWEKDSQNSMKSLQNEIDGINNLRRTYDNMMQESYDIYLRAKEDAILREKLKKATRSCGVNEYLGSDDACYCESGYLLSNDRKSCITPDQNCQELKGIYSHSGNFSNSDGSYNCYCDYGYEYNNSSSLCEEILTIEDEESISDAGESQFKNSILVLKNKGFISGYEDGTFKPFNPINRAEFIKIVIGAKFAGDRILDNCTNGGFSDVPDGAWFANYVCAAKGLGIVAGYSDGTFRPSQKINVAEALKITLKAFDIETREPEAGEAWFAPFTEYASQNNLYLNTFNGHNKFLTREDMAELVYRIMK